MSAVAFDPHPSLIQMSSAHCCGTGGNVPSRQTEAAPSSCPAAQLPSGHYTATEREKPWTPCFPPARRRSPGPVPALDNAPAPAPVPRPRAQATAQGAAASSPTSTRRAEGSPAARAVRGGAWWDALPGAAARGRRGAAAGWRRVGASRPGASEAGRRGGSGCWGRSRGRCGMRAELELVLGTRSPRGDPVEAVRAWGSGRGWGPGTFPLWPVCTARRFVLEGSLG